MRESTLDDIDAVPKVTRWIPRRTLQRARFTSTSSSDAQALPYGAESWEFDRCASWSPAVLSPSSRARTPGARALPSGRFLLPSPNLPICHTPAASTQTPIRGPPWHPGPGASPHPPFRPLSCPPPSTSQSGPTAPTPPRPARGASTTGMRAPLFPSTAAHRDPTSMPAQAGDAISSKPSIDPRPPQQPLCAAFLLELPGRYGHPSSPVVRVASEPGPLGLAMPLT